MALGSGSLATAQTVLHITGAQADRAAVNNAIGNILLPGFTAAYVGTTLSASNQAVFVGTTTSGAGSLPVVIQTDFIGTTPGVVDVAAQTTINGWLSSTGNTLTAATAATAPALITGGNSLTSPVLAAAAIPDAVISDNWQASLPIASGASETALTETNTGGVGVVTYVWAAGKGAPAPFTTSIGTATTLGSQQVTVSSVTGLKVGDTVSGNPNIPVGASIQAISGSTLTLSQIATATASGVATTYSYSGLSNISNQLAEALFFNGSVPLSQATGFASDNGSTLYLIGRSPVAGTKAAAIQEAYEGQTDTADGSNVLYSTELAFPIQYFPYDASNNIVGSASTGPIASFKLTPAVGATAPFPALNLGNNGFANNSQVASALIATNSAANSADVGYIGADDAGTAVYSGAVLLNYNGFPYSTSNVENGQYTFWTYAHFYYNSSHLSGNPLTVADAVGSQLLSSDSKVFGDIISNLAVARVDSTDTPQDQDGIIVF